MSFLHFAQTPPMGWNSWDCYGASVTEAEVIAHADFMAEHLKACRAFESLWLGVCRRGYSMERTRSKVYKV